MTYNPAQEGVLTRYVHTFEKCRLVLQVRDFENDPSLLDREEGYFT